MKKLLNFILRILLFHLKLIYGFIFSFFIIAVICVSLFSVATKSSNMINTNYDTVIFTMDSISDSKNSLLINNQKYSFYDVIHTLDDLRLNPKVKNLILNFDNISTTASQNEELTKSLEKFKLSGKTIYAYATNFDNQNYILATVADKIVMPNTLNSRLSLTGYYNSVLYFKDIFDKYGVSVDIINTGPHKAYGETYAKNKMSDEYRADNTRILDKRLDFLITSIAKYRNLDKDNLKNSMLDGSLASINSTTAKDLNLIDEVLDFPDFLNSVNPNQNEMININDLIKTKTVNSHSNKIVILPMENSIGASDEYNIKNITSSDVEKRLDLIENMNNVQAVILRINSPGGSALESELIHKAITNFSRKTNIPVYASLSDVAASGGYYIATSAKKIYANDSTITGSIGVVSLIPKFYKALDKFDINNEIISKGKFVKLYDPFHKLTDEDKQFLQRNLEDIYYEFKDRVSVSRNIDKEKLEKIAGGRVWLGEEAKNNGLVDDIKSLSEVIDTVTNDLKLINFDVVELNSSIEYESLFKMFKPFIKYPTIDKLQEKLLFITENKGKALYYNYALEKLPF